MAATTRKRCPVGKNRHKGFCVKKSYINRKRCPPKTHRSKRYGFCVKTRKRK